VVLAILARDNDMDLLGGVAADVGPEHDGVRRVTAEVLHLVATAKDSQIQWGDWHCETCALLQTAEL
jgi:hypothetical protein